MILRIVAVVVFCLTALPVAAQTRHAFIVGIDEYDNVPTLVKARNDARAISEALETAGFETDLHLDVDQVELLQALSRFSRQLDPGDEVVFFFAGHGVAIDGRNYLLPSDVPSVAPGAELVVTGRSLPVQQVIDQFNARGVRMSLLILDACRDNPFPQEGTRSLGRSAGLDPEAPPEGTFVMFSAGMGQQALDRLAEDDPNPNSVFTRVLLPRLTEPGLPLRQMVQQVRSEVRQLGRTIGHEQFPAVYDQLDGSFAFVDRDEIEIAAVPPAPPPPTDPCAAARTDWDIVGDTDSEAVLEAYRAAHSECPLMVAMATHRLASLQTPEEPEPVAPPQPVVAPQPEPEPAPSQEPEPEGDNSAEIAAAVAACEAVAHPDVVRWGDLVESNLARAEQICRSALQSGLDPRSEDYAAVQAFLGRTLDAQGRYSEALSYYRPAAEAGHETALNNIGWMYRSGNAVAQDYSEAARWFRAAAEVGSTSGMINLGALYEFGLGVTEDDGEAFRWYLRAAEAGNDRGMRNVAIMYHNGFGVDQNYGLASMWHRRAADAGNDASMVSLGRMYEAGSGVARDYTAAVRLFQEASDLGNAAGTAYLALMHFHGRGIDRNPTTAIRLFRIAAEGGNAMAMRNLGVIYRDGQHVSRNYDEAMRWYRAAADLGDATAMRFIAWLYQNGQGVSRNPAQAADWYLQALADGDDWLLDNTDEVTRDIIVEIQQRLRSAGYYTGGIDGAAGPGTLRAMQAYQDAQ